MKFLLLIIFIFFQTNLSYSLELKGKFEQGSFILGKTEPDSKIEIDNKKIRVSKEGYFAFGLGRDRKNDVVIKLFVNDLWVINPESSNLVKFILAIDPEQVTSITDSEIYLKGKERTIDISNNIRNDRFIFNSLKLSIIGKSFACFPIKSF